MAAHGQVQAAPKKKAEPRAAANQKVEEMAAKSYREQVGAKLADFLGLAGKARTSSLTLSNLEFADELAKKMLQHALGMEKVYLRINEAVKDKKTSEKDFKEILQRMDEKTSSHNKLQAWTTFKNMYTPTIELQR